MNKLKVLVSAYAFNPLGSPQLHPGEDLTGWNLVKQISRFNHVWVITHSYNEEGVRQAKARGELADVNVHFLRLPKILWHLYKIEFAQRLYYYLWQRYAWKYAKKLHETVGFDISHHVTFGNDWMPNFIGANLPVPFIWGPVGGGQRTPKKLMKEYTFYGRFSERVRLLAQWIGRRLPSRNRAAGKAKAILVCNRETKERMPAKYQGKVDYFPVNGISAEYLEMVQGNTDSGFVVLTAGRFHRLKGFSLGIKAFYQLAQIAPDARFIMVGKGPESKEMERLIRELGIKDRVQIQPWMPREDLLKMMQKAHVFLFPSFRDGGGAVVIEAMAAGKPVICVDSGGPGFHVQDGWGFKASPDSPDKVAAEMAGYLKILYQDPELRKKMGNAAYERVKNYYVWDRLGERLKTIYEQAVRGQR